MLNLHWWARPHTYIKGGAVLFVSDLPPHLDQWGVLDPALGALSRSMYLDKAQVLYWTYYPEETIAAKAAYLLRQWQAAEPTFAGLRAESAEYNTAQHIQTAAPLGWALVIVAPSGRRFTTKELRP